MAPTGHDRAGPKLRGGAGGGTVGWELGWSIGARWSSVAWSHFVSPARCAAAIPADHALASASRISSTVPEWLAALTGGAFVEVPRTDHGLADFATTQASFDARGRGPWQPAVGDALTAWMSGV